MRIEQYWDDVEVYIVVYPNSLNKKKFENKMIIVPVELPQESIKEKIMASFSEIKEITRLDYFDDGLYLKKG
ncbi:hypothetical protein [Carnobacterium maltaromaticum]|uniref:hypothetical protein n=1 Tax=Carnobacterium maltaromaticum TaxID=2751 RepID=UPI00295F1F0F|nr:hypothetical protein [Carnobacterium maltaromaticum]